MAGFRDIMAGSAYIEISLRHSRFLRGLRNVESMFTTTMERIGRGLIVFGQQMLTGGILGLATVALPLKQFADFEKAMDEVRVVAQATQAEFLKLEQVALDLGASTVFSSLQAAEAMSVFARAGLDVGEILNAIQPTLQAAAIAQMDMADAASIVSGVMRGMGEDFGESARVINVLTRAAIGSNTNIEELGNAFSYVGPLGRIAGESVESMAAAMMILANSNIRANRSGTNLRGMLLALQDPSEEAKTMLSRLRVSVQDSKGEFVGLSNVVAQFENRIGKLGGRQQAQVLAQIFDKRQISGFMALLSEGSAELMKFEAGLMDKEGLTSAEVEKEMMDNLYGDTIKLLSAINNFGIAVGKAIGDPLRVAVRGLTKGFNHVMAWVKANEELVAAMVAGFGILTAVGGAMLAAGIATNFFVFAVTGLMAPLSALASIMMAFTRIGSSLKAVMTSIIVKSLIPFQRLALLGARAAGVLSKAVAALSGVVGKLVSVMTAPLRLIGKLGSLLRTAIMKGLEALANAGGIIFIFSSALVGLASRLDGLVAGMVGLASRLPAVVNFFRALANSAIVLAAGFLQLYRSGLLVDRSMRAVYLALGKLASVFPHTINHLQKLIVAFTKWYYTAGGGTVITALMRAVMNLNNVFPKLARGIAIVMRDLSILYLRMKLLYQRGVAELVWQLRVMRSQLRKFGVDLGKDLTALATRVKTAFVNMWKSASRIFKMFIDELSMFGKEAVKAWGLDTKLQFVKTAFVNMLKSTSKIFKMFIDELSMFGKEAVKAWGLDTKLQFVVNRVRGMFSRLVSWFSGQAGRLSGATSGFSVSRMFPWIAQLQADLAQAWRGVVTFVGKFSPITKWIGGLFQAMGLDIRLHFNRALSAIMPMLQTYVVAPFQKVIGSIGSIFAGGFAGVGSALMAYLPRLGALFGSAVKFIFSKAFGIVTLISFAAEHLAGFFQYLITNLGPLSRKLGTVIWDYFASVLIRSAEPGSRQWVQAFIDGASQMTSKIIDISTKVKLVVLEVIKTIAGWLNSLVNLLITGVIKVVGFIFSMFGKVITWFGGGEMLNMFASPFQYMYKVAQTILGDIFSWFVNTFGGIFEYVGEIIGSLARYFTTAWGTAVTNVGSIFQGFLGFFGTLFDGAKGFLSGITNLFDADWGKIWEIFRVTVGGIYDALTNGDLGRAGKIAISGLKTVFINTLDTIMKAFGSSTEQLGGFFIDAFKNIGIAWQVLVTAFRQGSNTIADALAATGEWVGLLDEGTYNILQEDQKQNDEQFARDQQKKLDQLEKDAQKRKDKLAAMLQGYRDEEAELREEAFAAKMEREEREAGGEEIDKKTYEIKNPIDYGLIPGLGESAEAGKKRVTGPAATTVGAAVSGLAKVGLLGEMEKNNDKLDALMKLQKNREKRDQRAEDRRHEIQQRHALRIMYAQESAAHSLANASNGGG